MTFLPPLSRRQKLCVLFFHPHLWNGRRNSWRENEILKKSRKQCHKYFNFVACAVLIGALWFYDGWSAPKVLILILYNMKTSNTLISNKRLWGHCLRRRQVKGWCTFCKKDTRKTWFSTLSGRSPTSQQQFHSSSLRIRYGRSLTKYVLFTFLEKF